MLKNVWVVRGGAARSGARQTACEEFRADAMGYTTKNIA
jgi:hypothetical protein